MSFRSLAEAKEKAGESTHKSKALQSFEHIDFRF